MVARERTTECCPEFFLEALEVRAIMSFLRKDAPKDMFPENMSHKQIENTITEWIVSLVNSNICDIIEGKSE